MHTAEPFDLSDSVRVTALRNYGRSYRASRPLAVKAHRIVAREIEGGRLARPDTFTCADCGRYEACCYDHRDYTKPLDVIPVCGGCNKLRGPGYPYNQ